MAQKHVVIKTAGFISCDRDIERERERKREKYRRRERERGRERVSSCQVHTWCIVIQTSEAWKYLTHSISLESVSLQSNCIHGRANVHLYLYNLLYIVSASLISLIMICCLVLGK